MISLPQIKAARALLGWTQREMAKISGISLAAIAQIERGAGNPRATTMQTLQQAFENNGIEFTDDPGVRMQREPFTVNLWHGREAMLKVWKDIEACFAHGKGGEVLLGNLDDTLWQNFYSDVSKMLVRRKKLKIVTRALVADAKLNKTLPKEFCRVIPLAACSEAPYYVYENKVAIIKVRDPIRIILINNATLAESFRAQFQYHWEVGKKL